MIPTADYIRGFADGEGCVHFQLYPCSSGRKSLHLQVEIGNTNIELLLLICEGLKQLDIKSRIARRMKAGSISKKGIITRKDCYVLIIPGLLNLKQFYEKVGFLHEEKMRKLEQAFAYSKKEFDYVAKYYQALKLCKEGKTAKQIATTLDVTTPTIYGWKTGRRIPRLISTDKRVTAAFEKSYKKIRLRFSSNMVASLDPLGPAEEALVDKLMEGVATAKNTSWCG